MFNLATTFTIEANVDLSISPEDFATSLASGFPQQSFFFGFYWCKGELWFWEGYGFFVA